MYLLADVAEGAGEHELHLGVYIFHAVFDNKLSIDRQLVNPAQFRGQPGVFVLFQ